MSAATRYRLLTSGGPLAAVALVVLHLAVARSSGAWRGDPLWALQQLGSSFIIGLPVVLVVFAVPPILRGGVRGDEALLATRPGTARALRFAVDLAPVLVVHLAFVLWALVRAGGNGAALVSSSIVLTLVLHLLALAAVAAVGRAIGEVVRHPAAVMVAALAGVLLAAFGANALRVSAGSSPYAGLELVPGEYVVAGVVLAAAVVLVTSRLTRPRPAAAALGVAVLSLLVTGQVLGEPGVRASGERPDDCRDAGGMEVCVFDGYGFMLDDVVGPTRDNLAVLQEQGIDPHLEHVEQSTPGRRESIGTVPVPLDPAALEVGRLPASVVRSSLIHPTWCPAINRPEPLPAAFDQRQKEVYHWLEHAAGDASDVDYAAAVPEFAALSQEEQRASVQDFLDSNASCEGLS